MRSPSEHHQRIQPVLVHDRVDAVGACDLDHARLGNVVLGRVDGRGVLSAFEDVLTEVAEGHLEGLRGGMDAVSFSRESPSLRRPTALTSLNLRA